MHKVYKMLTIQIKSKVEHRTQTAIKENGFKIISLG